MSVTINSFGTYLDEIVFNVQLRNKNGVKAEFLTYGATWHSYKIKDKNNNDVDVIVSPNSLQGYLEQFNTKPYYFGSSIGRYAGRISRNDTNLILQKYSLSYENGVHLHGGPGGFARQHWRIKNIGETGQPSVTFLYQSPHMEEGYPGEMETEITYTLLDDNAISIEYRAEADRDTLINLTNHAYFNLGNESLVAQSLFIDSQEILELKPNLIPTGKLFPIHQTPYDMMDHQKLENLKVLQGLDDTYIFEKSSFEIPKIKLSSPSTGLEMQVYTDQPAVVVFAPKQLGFFGDPKNKDIDYSQYPAICFETQFPSDAINHPNFPSCILKKGDTYHQKTKFTFKKIA